MIDQFVTQAKVGIQIADFTGFRPDGDFPRLAREGCRSATAASEPSLRTKKAAVPRGLDSLRSLKQPHD